MAVGRPPLVRDRELARSVPGEPNVSRLTIGWELHVSTKPQQLPERCDCLEIGRVGQRERSQRHTASLREVAPSIERLRFITKAATRPRLPPTE